MTATVTKTTRSPSVCAIRPISEGPRKKPVKPTIQAREIASHLPGDVVASIVDRLQPDFVET